MIHSLSGGVITLYDKILYAFVQIDGEDVKRWFISPFPRIKAGDKAVVPVGKYGEAEATVLRVECVTAQTAPFPVKQMREIIRLLP